MSSVRKGISAKSELREGHFIYFLVRILKPECRYLIQYDRYQQVVCLRARRFHMTRSRNFQRWGQRHLHEKVANMSFDQPTYMTLAFSRASSVPFLVSQFFTGGMDGLVGGHLGERTCIRRFESCSPLKISNSQGAWVCPHEVSHA